MSTSNSFAYNTGSPIDGTTQVGDLSVGIPTSGYTDTPQYWNGPDQDLGYVVAKPVSGNTQPTPVFGITASVGFWGTKNMTNPLSDETFIQLSEYVANKNDTPQTFTAATEASSWLTANGYWNSYGAGFTLSPSDFTNANTGTWISTLSPPSDGFQTTGQSGPGEAFYGPNLSVNNGGNLPKLNEIRSYWTNNGLNVNTNAYMFNVTWGTGSTLSSGVVVMAFYDYGDNNARLNFGVVDTSDPIWQTPGTGYYSGPIHTLAGTWKLPATFTLVQPPITDNNNWC
jgi:hypothetical protein